MIRWRFVITRLVVVLAILMLLRWGLGPVANFLTVKGLQSVTGAKVEIAQTRVGLFPPRVQYVDLRIADPRSGKAHKDLVRAERVDLVIDGDALLHRRWVARDGRITGLKIGARRSDSGHFDTEPPEPVVDEGSSVLSKIVGIGAKHLEQQTRTATENLETVKRSEQIRLHWESEYDKLVARARGLESQVREIRDEATGIENPLRDWPKLERTLAQANQVRGELSSVRDDLESLPQRMQADIASLDDARKADLQKVERFVPGGLGEGEEVGIEIITAAVKSQIERVQQYLDNGRALASYTVVAPESERHRGNDFDLDQSDLPEVLVRRCEVGGVMRADGDVYALTGILENVTPTPQLLESPTRARLRLEGAETIRLEYVRDRRDGEDVDLLTLHWPRMKAVPMVIGDRDDAGVEINGGHREVWVQLKTKGDEIEGRLVSKQTGLNMQLHVDNEYESTAAVASLRQSLNTVDNIEVDATFAGTWRDIDLDVKTNLATILRDAAQEAIDGQVRDAKVKLAAQIDQTYRDQTKELQEWLSTHQGEARELLSSADEAIAGVSKKMLSEVGNADAKIGRLRGAIRGVLNR